MNLIARQVMRDIRSRVLNVAQLAQAVGATVEQVVTEILTLAADIAVHGGVENAQKIFKDAMKDARKRHGNGDSADT